MAVLDYCLYTELAVGQGHPTLTDVINRPLKSVLVASGLASDVDPFPGFLPLTGGTRTTTNLILTSTLAVAGNFAINTNKFTVVAASGNTLVAGTLAVTGDVAVATNKLTIAAASGNTVIAGTLGLAGNLAIATNKFTVAAASGNTVIAGTLGVTGAVTTNGGLQTFGANDSGGAGFRLVLVPNV